MPVELDITVQDVIGGYPDMPLVADSADFVWTAAGADFVAGAGFDHTGMEIILVRNDNVGAQTVTITSVLDAHNRLGTITTYSVGAGEYAAFGPFPLAGWQASDGDMNLTFSAADMYVAVLRLDDAIRVT